MQKTNINPEIFQDLLATAPNADRKGQSQYFTPIEWGQAFALPLPRCRYAVTDLNCGAGHLLQAAANKTTQHLLGADIDPCRDAAAPKVNPAARLHRITADVTLLFPLLQEANWRADLWALNPMWGLQLWRERLDSLESSDLDTVKQAFKARDPALPWRTIDSTIAMLLIALDRCTDAGEGLLVGNNSTLERLLFTPNAPHATAARHVWARLVIEGNPMSGTAGKANFGDGAFQTGVIWFARDHLGGPGASPWTSWELDGTVSVCQAIASRRDQLRTGSRIIDSFQTNNSAVPLWKACADEWTARSQPARTDYNLSLTLDGTIRANLNLFERESCRILKDQAAQLYTLHGKRPMELVLQRSQRELLERECNVGVGVAAKDPKEDWIWRVDPRLQEAVREAVRDYHACRAPLYPLPGLQRLGFLEEEDAIECRKDLWDKETIAPLFLAGKRYTLQTESCMVTRQGWKPNLEAEMEEIEYSGSELATYLVDERGQRRCFMESRLIEDAVEINGRVSAQAIDFTLQELDEHFIIPDVPDVAALNPEGFQRNLQILAKLEDAMNL